MTTLAAVFLAALAAAPVAQAPAAAAPALPQADQQAVADVAAGRRTEANAAWWGFDPDDATAALQAAFDSGAKRVVVPNMGRPWLVRPLQLRSRQEVVFEKGVEIVAKPGAFPTVHDVLLTAADVEDLTLTGHGAVVRMQKAEYTEGEWRHTLSLRGCRNVRVEGLTLRDSGGDGVYVGRGTGSAGRAWCENVILRALKCENHRRQGISVITAKGLLIEDCLLAGTSGTAPQAGIDFEPNRPDEKLVDCVMRRSTVAGNAGAGLHVYAANLDGTSDDVSIRVEDCVFHRNQREALSVHGLKPEGPKGLILFVNCRMAYNRLRAGLSVGRKAPEAALLRLERCTFALDADSLTDGGATERSALVFYAGSSKSAWTTGGVEFVDCRISEPRARPIIEGIAPKGLAAPFRDVRGTVAVSGPAAAQPLPDWAAGLKVTPGDEKPGK